MPRSMFKIPLRRSPWKAAALIAVLAAAQSPTAATADAVPCAATANLPAHRAAIASAEAWLASRWRRSGETWITAYRLKPEQSLPLGIGRFGHVGGLDPGQSQPVVGLAKIARITCASFEMNPGPTYAVRFAGHALQFDENGRGWSRPIVTAVIHVLDVRLPDTPDGTATVIELAESRTALPPDAELRLPDAPAALRPASKRR